MLISVSFRVLALRVMVSAAIWRMIMNRRSEPINFCALELQIADLNLTPCFRKSSRVRSEDSGNFSGHPYIGRIVRSSLR